MLMYALIGLSLVLLGVAGLQFTYMFYIDKVYKERRKYIQELEKKNLALIHELEIAERRVARQNETLASLGHDEMKDEEVWADVIGDS
jgi:hypothetical protein